MDDQILDVWPNIFWTYLLTKAKPCPISHTEQHKIRMPFLLPRFPRQEGWKTTKTTWIFWSGWRMISRTLVPLASLPSIQAGWFPMQCLMSRWIWSPDKNWMGEMMKDHVFFCRFFISGWMCLICCNNLLVLKWTKIFVLIINQYIPDCFFLVFACCILKNRLPNGLLNLSKRASSHKNVWG